MSDYMDIGMFKKTRNGKPYFVRMGSAAPREGGGFFLNLDALPYGEGTLVIVPQREKAGGSSASGAPARSDLDDAIPF